MTPREDRFYVAETSPGYRTPSHTAAACIEVMVLDGDCCHEVAWTSGLVWGDVELIHARGDAGRVCDRFNRECAEGVAAA